MLRNASATRCLVLLLFGCCLPAAAVSPGSEADVRCFISAASLLQSPNNDVRAAAASSALYYLGKLDGRDPDMDLEKVILAEAAKMTSTQLRAETEACGKQLSARGAAVNAIGRKLTITNPR